MKDMITYKGYTGSVHYSDEDGIFYGKIEFIKSLISYEATEVNSLRKVFREAVDDYLELCKEECRKPEQPFRGSFNIRPGTDLHRRAALAAREKGIKLNQLVSEALEKYLQYPIC